MERIGVIERMGVIFNNPYALYDNPYALYNNPYALYNLPDFFFIEWRKFECKQLSKFI